MQLLQLTVGISSPASTTITSPTSRRSVESSWRRPPRLTEHSFSSCMTRKRRKEYINDITDVDIVKLSIGNMNRWEYDKTHFFNKGCELSLLQPVIASSDQYNDKDSEKYGGAFDPF